MKIKCKIILRSTLVLLKYQIKIFFPAFKLVIVLSNFLELNLDTPTIQKAGGNILKDLREPLLMLELIESVWQLYIDVTS